MALSTGGFGRSSVVGMHHKKVLGLMNVRREQDWKVPCPAINCTAKVGDPCNLPDGCLPFGVVHLGRRVKAIMSEKGITDSSLEKRLHLASNGKFGKE